VPARVGGEDGIVDVPIGRLFNHLPLIVMSAPVSYLAGLLVGVPEQILLHLPG